MGKPIAGRNKPPFGVGGINVDAVVLKNGTKLTNIKISKQRSNSVFDLLSNSGQDIYTFLTIASTDKDGNPLDVNDSPTALSNKLAVGTFCISIFDPQTSEIVGFADKLLLHKIILNDGKVFFIDSYKDQEDVTVPVIGIVLNKTTSTGVVGGTEQLSYTIDPTNATNKAVSWSTSNESVATVSATGLVTFVANGSANITVTTDDGSKTSVCAYTITTGVSNVTLNKSTTSGLTGASEVLTATVTPSSASDKSVSWVSSSPAVATITPIDASTATLNFVGNGSSTITVTTTSGAKTATCVATVTTAVTGVTLNKSTSTGLVGGTEQLTATVAPATASNKTVNWTTNAAGVATVSTTGLVTFAGNGSAIITATTADGAKTATCSYTVTTAVASVSVTPATGNNTIGGTVQLTANVLPATASNKTVNWTSATPAVATVNSSGLVTIAGVGTSVITATTVDGAKTGTSTITGNPILVSTVTMTETTYSGVAGSNHTLTANVLPANATNKALTWSSTDTNFVTVNSSTGEISLVAEGTATITATSTDGSNKSATCDVTVTAA